MNEAWRYLNGRRRQGLRRHNRVLSSSSRMTVFDATDSITICGCTTDETDAPLFRLAVEPNERNGLLAVCRLMVDKITTVPKSRIGANIGRLDDADILRLNQAVIVFLGLAVSPRLKP